MDSNKKLRNRRLRNILDTSVNIYISDLGRFSFPSVPISLMIILESLTREKCQRVGGDTALHSGSKKFVSVGNGQYS